MVADMDIQTGVLLDMNSDLQWKNTLPAIPFDNPEVSRGK
jgi:hypothetical protein